MKFTNKNGELRIYDGGGTTTAYLRILFTNADLNAPLQRGKPEEQINLDRGNFDSNASYSEGPDNPIVDPLPITFSGKIDDTSYTHDLVNWLSGVTHWACTNTSDFPSGVTLTSTKGTTSLIVGGSAVSTPAFADSSKQAYNIEVLFDGSTDIGWRWSEVYFPPNEQTIVESEDAITLNVNGQWYGAGTTITAFSSGSTVG